jgi:hypothetical protein
MYSKEEALRIKKEFWIAFAEAYPRKWLLYDTKIKDFTFKFYIDNKKAAILLEIEPKDNGKRTIYYEKMKSLQAIILEDYLPQAIFEKNYHLENGKIVSRVWVTLEHVSVNNRATWEAIFNFFAEQMDAFERFFYEYQEYLSDLEINT